MEVPVRKKRQPSLSSSGSQPRVNNSSTKRHGCTSRQMLLFMVVAAAMALGLLAGIKIPLNRLVFSLLPTCKADVRLAFSREYRAGKIGNLSLVRPQTVVRPADSLSLRKFPEDDPMVRHKMVDQTELRKVLAAMDSRNSKYVVGTIANMAFKEILLNWLSHVLRSNITNVLIAALDADVQKVVAEHGVASLLMNSKVTQKNFRGDPEAFKHMGSLKTAFILSILEEGWDVLMSDTDVTWLRNPTDVLSSKAEMGATDILVSTDSVSYSNDVASMQANSRERVRNDIQGWFRYASNRSKEIFGNAYEHAFNTGVLYLRATNVTLQFCQDWHDVMRTRGKSQNWTRIWGDQHALNQLMRQDMFPIKVVDPGDGSPRHNRIIWTYCKRLRLGILPPVTFCNGHMFFVQRIPQSLGISPYVVHNTFQFHSAHGKAWRFREYGLWLLDPPSFYTDGNFLSFDISLPRYVSDEPEDVLRHVAAIRYYYESIRNAYAIALILNRSVILPKVTCFCDRWWDTLTAPCRAPGGDVDPPFTCPVDHYLDPSFWAHMGPVRFRQSTFLDNPQVPKEVLSSRMVVAVRGVTGKPKARNALPANATDVEVLKTLKRFNKTRILHLTNTFDAFCRFEQNFDNLRFDFETGRFFRMHWCCAPGHVGYNITLPRVVNRTYEECNRPTLTVPASREPL